MSIEFFQTQMGQSFYSGTMPRIARALDKIAEAMTKDDAKQAEERKVLAHLMRRAAAALDSQNFVDKEVECLIEDLTEEADKLSK